MIASQFLEYVVEPTLKRTGLYSPEAVKLLMMTAAHESQFKFVEQVGGGEARGFFQMEEPTLDDLVDKLSVRHADKVQKLYDAKTASLSLWDSMYANFDLQVIAARLHYWRFPQPLPEIDDIEGMWRYYKQYYNTPLGKATKTRFLEDWARYKPDTL